MRLRGGLALTGSPWGSEEGPRAGCRGEPSRGLGWKTTVTKVERQLSRPEYRELESRDPMIPK